MELVQGEKQKTLEITNVSKSFGDFQVLDAIDLHVSAGEIVGILGPNGAGKSTLLRACEGLEKVDEGRIQISGADLTIDRGAVKGRIGLVLQRPKFSSYATVCETIDLFKSFHPISIPVDYLTDVLGMTSKLDTRIAKLSGGERQRLGVLVGLMGGQELTLLDEPTSELDPQARRVVWQLISEKARRHNAAILMTTHQMEEAEVLCDRIYIVNHGRIISSGSPAQIIMENCDTMTLTFMVREDVFKDLGLASDGLGISRHGQFLKCRKEVASSEEGQALMHDFLRRFGPNILEVALQRPNLEDVFIKLTGTHLRG